MGFVCCDDLHAPFLVVQRVQDFVQARVSLLLVHELHQLCKADVFPFCTIWEDNEMNKMGVTTKEESRWENKVENKCDILQEIENILYFILQR